jgi:hypothetical protein
MVLTDLPWVFCCSPLRPGKRRDEHLAHVRLDKIQKQNSQHKDWSRATTDGWKPFKGIYYHHQLEALTSCRRVLTVMKQADVVMKWWDEFCLSKFKRKYLPKCSLGSTEIKTKKCTFDCLIEKLRGRTFSSARIVRGAQYLYRFAYRAMLRARTFWNKRDPLRDRHYLARDQSKLEGYSVNNHLQQKVNLFLSNRIVINIVNVKWIEKKKMFKIFGRIGGIIVRVFWNAFLRTGSTAAYTSSNKSFYGKNEVGIVR